MPINLCARKSPFTFIYANEFTVSQNRNIHIEYIQTSSHLTQDSSLLVLPEQFPASALPRWSRDARPLWSHVRLCTTALRSPSLCCQPETLASTRVRQKKKLPLSGEDDGWMVAVVQEYSLKLRFSLTLHFSTTQHSGVTSYPKYSIKWGPGTNTSTNYFRYVIQEE